MGDRVMSKSIKDKTEQKYNNSVGKYISIVMDAPTDGARKAMLELYDNENTLRVAMMRLKDRDYIDQARKRLAEEVSPFKAPTMKDDEYIRK